MIILFFLGNDLGDVHLVPFKLFDLGSHLLEKGRDFVPCVFPSMNRQRFATAVTEPEFIFIHTWFPPRLGLTHSYSLLPDDQSYLNALRMFLINTKDRSHGEGESGAF